jgi:hypothetical protein
MEWTLKCVIPDITYPFSLNISSCRVWVLGTIVEYNLDSPFTFARLRKSFECQLPPPPNQLDYMQAALANALPICLSVRLPGGIHQCEAIILAAFRCLCQQVTSEVNSLQADFLAIATRRLVNAKYWGSQIQPCAYPAQRGIEAGFH